MSSGTICFIPCCKSKNPVKSSAQSSTLWYENASFGQMLLKGRDSMKARIDMDAPQTEALSLYSGHFYRVLDKQRINDNIQNDTLRVFILSAGYGIVEAQEFIQDYDAKMEGSIARTWKNEGLTKIIAETLLKYQPDKVFGFFAGEKNWAGSISKYRYFYSEGVKQALSQGLKATEAGCFYRAEGQSAGPILSALGLCFMEAVSSDFSDAVINSVNEIGFRHDHYPSVLLKYDRFV